MIFFAFIQQFFVLSIFSIFQVVSFQNFVENSKSSIFRVTVPSISGDGTFPTPPITMRFKSGCARKNCFENVFSDFRYFFHDRCYSSKRYSSQGHTFRGRFRRDGMGCGQGAYDFESTRGIFYLAALADFGATGEGALLFSVTSI